ncbi:MAG: metallophosphoesterase family protein [Chloroflexota bacterium]
MPLLAVLSDIHGNLPALEAVLTNLQNFPTDQIIVAGDVINFGPSPRQTAEIVIEKGWPVIRGNNEYFLLDYNTPRAPAEWDDPVQFAPTAWLDRQIPHEMKSQIACWPDTLNLRFKDAPPVTVFHGAPSDPWDSIYWTLTDEEITKLLSSVAADFMICGHTHLPMDRQVGRWRIFNPGSVGVPLDGIFSASYMLLEGNEHGWTPTFRRVPFDYEAIFQAFEESGYNRECGPMGRLVVEIYRQARPMLGFLRWRQAHRPDQPMTDELLDEYFENCKWWEYAHPAYHINMK